MKLRVPHTFALLFGLVALAALATHWIPAGQFERVEHAGRLLVEPGSSAPASARPATLADVFLAFPRGLQETAYIVFYIFLIGGAFSSSIFPAFPAGETSACTETIPHSAAIALAVCQLSPVTR